MQLDVQQDVRQVVQLVLFAQWCGPCQAEAPELESAWRDLEDDGVVILSVMMENSSGSAPSVDDLNSWVNDYDCTHPVLEGTADLAASIQGGYPTLPVLNRDMTIASLDNFPFDSGYLASLAAD